MNKPDWRVAKDYEFITLEKIGREGVAWEFLRRNKKYQSDVQCVGSGTVVDQHGKKSVEIKNSLFLHTNTDKGFFDPPLLDGESERGWITRCLDKGFRPRILSPEQYIIEKWSLRDHLPPPGFNAYDLDIPPKFEVQKVPRIILKWDEVLELQVNDQSDLSEDCPVQLDADNIVIVFSLNKSITPQWRHIKTKLANLQKERKKLMGQPSLGSPKESAWIPALRAWDSKVSNPEMQTGTRAKFLYGSSDWQANKKYDDHFKTAARLIDFGYLDILRRSS